jgi:hypothetical protein
MARRYSSLERDASDRTYAASGRSATLSDTGERLWKMY